ncbi:MAG: hypothetical protein ISS15_07560 [Alphaproteobacteria bacterium]|nr:hypothetical protein [Alphaproteobacteria bacterium]MBL6936728.1 hypothetical protein [Alphaproteobacteria bacterium]MBL7097497.1 hypothetical protein [Alphaproteobacteria bacterium]
MLRWRAGLAVLLLSSGPAVGESSVSPAPESTTVTIYHIDGVSTADLVHPDNPSSIQDEGLAFVTETREVDIPAGPAEIRFRGVASTMVPQTADIEGLPNGVLERNFDYDLLSPGSLLAKSIGETVHLVRTDAKTGKRTETPAIIRTGADGTMLEIDGKLEALRCSGLPEKLVFEKTPDGLTDTPTLSVRTNAPVAGHYKIKLSYIATGLSWSADYVAHVLPGGHALDLSGWLTLANFGSTGFGRIPVYTVAGRLNATGGDTPVHPWATHADLGCWPTDIDWATHNRLWMRLNGRFSETIQSVPLAAPGATETIVVTGSRIDPRQLGDYKLYALPEPTDMPAHETKQVQFMDLHHVPFDRVYTYMDGEGGADGGPARTVLRLHNTAEGGLGKPMPAGNFSVSENGPDGMPIFVGQAGVSDTPVGLPVEIALGTTVSVLVRRTVVDEATTGKGESARTRRTVAFDISNTRVETVAFELWEGLENGQLKVLSESAPHTEERGAAIWHLSLKPGEKMLVRISTESAD